MGTSSRFLWYELATNDIEAAQAFYADVVGWVIGDASSPGSVYRIFTAGGTPIAGLTVLPPEARRNGLLPQWRGYVGVGDVDTAAGRVSQLGGTVLIPPTDIPGISRFSVIADPEMATLALVKGREGGHEPPVRLGEPGHVGWHELLASDLDKAFAFYSGLLGWQKAEGHTDQMGTYQQFSAGPETIGGMFTRPGTSVQSAWLYYFNVNDIVAAAKRAKAGGGQILYGPDAVPGGARVVHCMDAEGAIFALIDKRVRISVGCYSARDPAVTPGAKRPG